MKAVIELPSTEQQAAFMVQTLHLAREMYFSEDPDRDRIAARTALAACIRFIATIVPHGIELVLPLRELNYALHDLDLGVCANMLKRATKKGRRMISVRDETFRAMAAALMDLYEETENRAGAAELAATRLNELGYRNTKNKSLAAAEVEDWRDKVKEGGDSLGAKRFRRTLKALRQLFPSQPEKAIELLLGSLSAIRRPDGLAARAT